MAIDTVGRNFPELCGYSCSVLVCVCASIARTCLDLTRPLRLFRADGRPPDALVGRRLILACVPGMAQN